ncbi:hypothetical protein B0H16DRAFT_115739 [Mycena metata]|uniref:DUF8205 domain-containing protein n=1 Tax=Mycena metata TaxID=1033252 RepID=A0AAD7JXP2_9AGAR|nr:hypothetical protein B0H16DRAFT_115739 [Mycena metata]
MYHLQLCAILELDLVDRPANAFDHCLYVAVDTEMPADPMGHLQARLNGQVNPDPTYILWVRRIEKKPIELASPAARDSYRAFKASLSTTGMSDWPVVLVVFTTNNSVITEISYAVEPKPMQHCREKRPSTYLSGMSGRGELPLSKETIREDLNNLILMDKSNQYLLRTKFKSNSSA